MTDLIRGWRELAAHVGMHEVSVRRMIERGEDFPLPLRLSQSRIVWVRAEVDEWLRSRPRGLQRMSKAVRDKIRAKRLERETERAP